MQHAKEFFVNTLFGGLLVVVPIYLALLLLLKAMQSVAGLVRPVAKSEYRPQAGGLLSSAP